MKNKKNVVLGLFIVTVLTLGVTNVVSANTYQYINTSGQLSSVTANSSQEALRTAYQIAPHSGVILVNTNTNTNIITNNQPTQGTGLYLYQYINTSGQLSSVTANSPQEALRTAYQIAPHSGVILK